MRGVHLIIAVLMILLAAGTIYRAATRPLVITIDEPDQLLMKRAQATTTSPFCQTLPPAMFDAPQLYQREVPTPPKRIEQPEDLT